MGDSVLLAAVKTGDLQSVARELDSGADINQEFEQGWTPLCFAAGRGDLAIVKRLIEKGADVFKTGRDNRTPYLIALAAGRIDVVKYLREIEDQTAPEKAQSFRPKRKYCKAFYLRDLKRFPNWPQLGPDPRDNGNQKERANNDLTDDDVVFVHEDLSVTKSMWHNEKVLFSEGGSEWREFCTNALGFKVPDDLDLIVPAISKP